MGKSGLRSRSSAKGTTSPTTLDGDEASEAGPDRTRRYCWARSGSPGVQPQDREENYKAQDVTPPPGNEAGGVLARGATAGRTSQKAQGGRGRPAGFL